MQPLRKDYHDVKKSGHRLHDHPDVARKGFPTCQKFNITFLLSFISFIGVAAMRTRLPILSILLMLGFIPAVSFAQVNPRNINFDFYGDSICLSFPADKPIEVAQPLTSATIHDFYVNASDRNYKPVIEKLLYYKEKYKLDDWLYYQLIRKTAQQVSPKADNYHRYTLYKWFFLTGSGYDATLSIAGNQLLFYVRSEENIYNIPFRLRDGKQYVCLNYHDYGNINFEQIQFSEVQVNVPGAENSFSYKVTQLPNFRPGDYLEKDIRFSYNQHDYFFRIKLNPQIKSIFANYPVVDYESYFNIPLSAETYRSLIPILKNNVKGMNTKNGVDYLMRFTRYAFLFETDSRNFGNEKRLTPEQTLLYEQSDCEDRAALFFYLVKEIYNLPMIVLTFPEHVTVAVKFDKPIGKPILYKGNMYSVCEPTPQQQDLELGQLLPNLAKLTYEIAYAYTPNLK